LRGFQGCSGLEKKRSGPSSAGGEALAATPFKSSWVTESQGGEGLVRLTYPMKYKTWFQPLARRLGQRSDGVRTRTLELDQMGSRAWRLIDGRRTVQDLIDVFVKEFGLHPRESEAAMTTFIRQLGRRGLIGLS
jgi:Coenzyme PQQ synthesis protein D (PqqD).